VSDHLGPAVGDERAQRGVGHVHFDQLGAVPQVDSRGQVVDPDDFVAFGDQPVNEMGTDEAGRAGDQYEHTGNIPTTWRRCENRRRMRGVPRPGSNGPGGP
jgi:hypothetical protein